MVRKTKEEAERTRQLILDAASEVFHEHGVSNASLAQVAAAAGVTRGAVYWHFEDKAALFFALHETACAPLQANGDAWLLDETLDPLLALEQAISSFFEMLMGCPKLWKMFETMVLRCEYVKEFATVRQEVNRPAREFLAKVQAVYRRAAEGGGLRAGLDPELMALDTWVFVSGLLHQLLLVSNDDILRPRIPQMIAAHIALRRRSEAT